jgi:hypothetical protein
VSEAADGYKTTRFKPTPEQVAMVRRWVAEQDPVLKERLREAVPA